MSRDWTLITSGQGNDPLAGIRLRVPETWLAHGPPGPARLEWRWTPEHGTSPLLTDAMWQFITLAEASSDEILGFARRFGPLGLAQRTFAPATYGEPAAVWLRYWERDALEPREEHPDGAISWEPISAWRFYSRRLRARLTLIGELNEGKYSRHETLIQASATIPETTSIEALDHVYQQGGEPRLDVMPRLVLWELGRSSLEETRQLISIILDDAAGLPTTSLGPVLRWDQTGRSRVEAALPTTRLDPSEPDGQPIWLVPSLIDTLTFALMNAAHTKRVLICDNCNVPYPLPWGKKRPRRDRQKFHNEACRYEARKRTKAAAERQRYGRRRAEMHEGRSVRHESGTVSSNEATES